MREVARLLIFMGLLTAGIGVLFYFASSIPGMGRLPGDIQIKGKNSSFYFPLASCLLISLLLTLLLNFFFRSR